MASHRIKEMVEGCMETTEEDDELGDLECRE
jgi:hypothetical protein